MEPMQDRSIDSTKVQVVTVNNQVVEIGEVWISIFNGKTDFLLEQFQLYFDLYTLYHVDYLFGNDLCLTRQNSRIINDHRQKRQSILETPNF